MDVQKRLGGERCAHEDSAGGGSRPSCVRAADITIHVLRVFHRGGRQAKGSGWNSAAATAALVPRPAAPSVAAAPPLGWGRVHAGGRRPRRWRVGGPPKEPSTEAADGPPPPPAGERAREGACVQRAAAGPPPPPPRDHYFAGWRGRVRHHRCGRDGHDHDQGGGGRGGKGGRRRCGWQQHAREPAAPTRQALCRAAPRRRGLQVRRKRSRRSKRPASEALPLANKRAPASAADLRPDI